MNHVQILKRLTLFPLRAAYWSSVLLLGFTLAACGGGGGGGSAVTEAVVSNIGDAAVLEGSTANGMSELVFTVTFDKPVVSRLELIVNTSSPDSSGYDRTPPGIATGGPVCSGSVDYVQLVENSIVFSTGASNGKITVKVCQDAEFEPNEKLYVKVRTSTGQNYQLEGTIINDETGGLNSTGATNLMGRLLAFGRDFNPLTNSNSDDGALGFSFSSLGACTEDKVTGLTWKNDLDNVKYSDRLISVDIANSGAGLCGKKYWRVPTVNELLSLMDFGKKRNESANADVKFSSPMTGEFWTSQNYPTGTSSPNAWVLDARNGGAVSYERKTDSNFLRLVSGDGITAGYCGPSVGSVDLFEYKNGGTTVRTVYDQKSGLMWKRCSEGDTGEQCQPSNIQFNTNIDEDGVAAYISSWVENVNKNPTTLGAGFSDWRLPSIKELASLVDRCRDSGPAINAELFPGTYDQSYLTSTNDANNIAQSWVVDFSGGGIVVDSRAFKRIRLVRAGQ